MSEIEYRGYQIETNEEGYYRAFKMFAATKKKRYTFYQLLQGMVKAALYYYKTHKGSWEVVAAEVKRHKCFIPEVFESEQEARREIDFKLDGWSDREMK